MISISRFRPLIGVSFCKPGSYKEYEMIRNQVSVPLSGLVSVNNKFRVYYGESDCRFRPLIGVSFCKLAMAVSTLANGKVSVPLSGLVSVNEVYINESAKPRVIVSVPLSGLVSVNTTPSKPL